MFYGIVFLLLALITFSGVVGEAKKFAPLFLVAFVLTLVLGLGLMTDGITYAYGYDLREGVGGDLNYSTVDYNSSNALTITTAQDTGVFAMAYFLFFGSFGWLFWGLLRTRQWFKQDLKKRYFGD